VERRFQGYSHCNPWKLVQGCLSKDGTLGIWDSVSLVGQKKLVLRSELRQVDTSTSRLSKASSQRDGNAHTQRGRRARLLSDRYDSFIIWPRKFEVRSCIRICNLPIQLRLSSPRSRFVQSSTNMMPERQTWRSCNAEHAKQYNGRHICELRRWCVVDGWVEWGDDRRLRFVAAERMLCLCVGFKHSATLSPLQILYMSNLLDLSNCVCVCEFCIWNKNLFGARRKETSLWMSPEQMTYPKFH
jgi:hypothetical protein